MNLQGIKQRYEIIGSSPKLDYALSVAQRVAPTELTVLIAGESGVGKEVFSKIIHQLSPRKHNKFIAINCGAIPEGTIDSELFGHKKGAFTGATDNRKGYFETANGGTIFLDEIGEMPLGTQARLLRLLESGEYIKVGASEVQKTDVRVIAATNVNLLEKVQAGKFREDLYYRLSTVPIEVPALRERKEDIFLLFRKFTTDFAEKYRSKLPVLSEDAVKSLQHYNWPGNVRELKNVAEQVCVLSADEHVSADDIRQFLPEKSGGFLLAPAQVNGNQSDFSEREIFYKMLIDMKRDLNNIKSYLTAAGHEEAFVSDGNHETGQFSESNALQVIAPEPKLEPVAPEYSSEGTVIISDSEDHYEAESFDENLSLADMEKTLIEKALTKHSGKRKRAALELGISERTLYRKIKEYDIKQ